MEASCNCSVNWPHSKQCNGYEYTRPLTPVFHCLTVTCKRILPTMTQSMLGYTDATQICSNETYCCQNICGIE